MIDVRVKLPNGERVKVLRLLDGKAMQFAEVQAINRTAANMQKLALKIVARKMGVTTAQIKKRGRGTTARGGATKKAGKYGTISQGRKANRRTLSTTVDGYGRPWNAGRWEGREIRSGATSGVGGRRDARGGGTVIGTTHSAYGRPQVALRTWRLKNGAIVKRKTFNKQSFTGVYGPGIGQQMEKPKVARPLTKYAQKQFAKHFKASVEFAFSPAGLRAVSGVRGSRR